MRMEDDRFSGSPGNPGQPTLQTIVCNDRGVSGDEPLRISITLSPTQVDAIVRAASRRRGPSVHSFIRSALDDSDGVTSLLLDEFDPRLSRSLLRGLSLLASFEADGSERGIVELASDLDMSPSTAHRYAHTLVELGLLERCPTTRKYRLPET